MKRYGGRRGGIITDWKQVAALAVVAVLAIALVVVLVTRQRAPEPEPEAPVPNPVATITMRDGKRIRLELYPEYAPNTVANFVKLANDGFYDGQEFFRIVSGVFIQGGDPNHNGTGDPGYAIKGEFEANGFKNDLSHVRGTISMARPSGYDTAGSQFFIMQGSYPEYDGRYAAFGSIDEGDAQRLATLDALGSQPTDATYLPLTRQVIASIRVETFDVDYGDPETLKRE